MNICNTSLHTISLYYPLGNTPAVCLTQDLPPEQEVDILLLGCGDARNILFTCFADNARKIDVTCCDIEPIIHARNVLLYTLLLDDESNRNIELIWNIYHNWKLDEISLELLETQTKKLLQVAESTEQWENSVYGSTIRFCDERSLALIKRYWLGFTSQKNEEMLLAVIIAVKAYRQALVDNPDGMSYRSTFPTSSNSHAHADVSEVTKKWWNCGVAPSSNSSARKYTRLNPAFLYSPNYQLVMHAGTSPLGGIPLSTAYTSMSEGSPFHRGKKSLSFTEHLVDCAKIHFAQWAIAFRRAATNGSVIRIFSGDAFAFCFTLRNCQLTGSTSMNLSCHNLTNSPLILNRRDYGMDRKSDAPLSFDVIDTSNLADHLGPLNLIILASSLLKHLISSNLYTELLTLVDFNVIDRLKVLCGVDLRSLALLLGLVLPDLFTNATNSVEEYPSLRRIANGGTILTVSARSRLRWRRSGEHQASNNSPNVQIEAKELAKFLILVYNEMFKLEDVDDNMMLQLSMLKIYDPEAYKVQAQKLHFRQYNRASFALLLSCLKANVFCDWDECVKEMYDKIFFSECFEAFKWAFMEDLALQMHIFGVDDRLFNKPDPADMRALALIFPECDSPPDQLCVTIRVARERLGFLTHLKTTLAFICSFEVRNSYRKCKNSFSSPKIVFGKLLKRNKSDDPLNIEEDDEILGSSDMFLSVVVPTSMLASILLQSAPFMPLVKCKLKYSLLTSHVFGPELSQDLCFACHELTSEDVFVTRFMPGMPGLPTFAPASNPQEKAASEATVLHLSSDDTKIHLLVKRLILKSEAAKTKLAMKSSVVKVDFESPLTAIVSIAGSLRFKLKFPAPVSVSKFKVKVDRESLYVEVQSSLLNPLEEDVPTFVFPCSLMKVPSGIVPVPWTSTRVNLDIMPSVDLKEVSWLLDYLLQVFSRRECKTRMFESEYEFRASLKQGFLFMLTLFAGSEGPKVNIFEVEDVDSCLKIFILPSSLCLDFASSSVVLDSALVLLTEAMVKDPLVARFLVELCMNGHHSINVNKAENLAWKAMMPALVERCRTWKHTSKCEYIQAGEVPLPKSIKNDESPICSCGIGKFPADYLKDRTGKISTLSSVLSRYATRAAISPIFSVQYVEDCDTLAIDELEVCAKCGNEERKNIQTNNHGLLTCGRCKAAKYCSADCQKAHWRQHKLTCKAA